MVKEKEKVEPESVAERPKIVTVFQRGLMNGSAAVKRGQRGLFIGVSKRFTDLKTSETKWDNVNLSGIEIAELRVVLDKYDALNAAENMEIPTNK